MFRWLVRSLVMVGVMAAICVALVVGIAGYWWYREASGTGTLPNGVTYTRYTMETTRSLSLDDARKHWHGFVFPDSATNIHIAAYHEWQAAVEVVRFEAPVEDCLATARQIMQAHNASEPANQTGDLATELHRHRMHHPGPPLKATWFTPESIRVGQAVIGNGEYTPDIWIDTERGIFYFHRYR